MVFVRCNIIFWCFVLTRISTTNCVKFGKTPSVRTNSAVASLREIPDSSVTSQARSNEATSTKLKANGFENSESSLSSYLAWQIECYTLRKMWWSIMLLTLNHDILSSKLPGLLKNTKPFPQSSWTSTSFCFTAETSENLIMNGKPFDGGNTSKIALLLPFYAFQALRVSRPFSGIICRMQ